MDTDKKGKKHKKEDFKEPKSAAKLSTSSKTDRYNRSSQIRMRKVNEYILKKRGLVDADESESSFSKSHMSLSHSNLTALIDTNVYKTPPKSCAIVALNAQVDVDLVIKNFEQTLNPEVHYKVGQLIWTALVPNLIFKGKERLSLLRTNRDIYSILDTCKAADFIIFVSSCQNTDYSKWKTDPDKYSHTIDEFGYEILSMLRVQGLPRHIGLLQHLEVIPTKNKTDIKKLFTRYFDSELKPDKVFASSEADDVKAMTRHICAASAFTVSLDLRKHRSYMVCEKVNPVESVNGQIDLELYGYIRGNTLNVNNYIHLTGFGDYLVSSVETVDDPCPNPHNNDKFQLSQKLGNMEIDSENKENKAVDDKIENIQGHLKGDNVPTVIGTDKSLMSQKKQAEKKDEEIIDFDIDIKDDDEDDLSFVEEDDQEDEDGKISNKHKMKTSLQYRTIEEMEFPDEVDTPIEVPARERFNKYRGLASMKTGSWDPLEDLPREYANIYSFEYLKHTWKQAVQKAHMEGQRISGSYIKISIKNFSREDLKYIRSDIPLIMSTLLEYERKLCVMHYKISLNYESDIKVSAKQTMETQVGFRRILTKPIYCAEVSAGSDKLKIEKVLIRDKFYIASVYSQMTYPQSPVIFLRPSNENGNGMHFVASGQVLDTDSKKIILKRIILTGYPVKIKKKRAVARFMFFNPDDVNYFKPIQLITKHGLRGHITESLGTHGHMKCVFNDHLKPNDTVCLNLYKRVFPKWFKESWKYKVFYGDRPDYSLAFKDEKKEILENDTTKVEDNDKMMSVDNI